MVLKTISEIGRNLRTVAATVVPFTKWSRNDTLLYAVMHVGFTLLHTSLHTSIFCRPPFPIFGLVLSNSCLVWVRSCLAKFHKTRADPSKILPSLVSRQPGLSCLNSSKLVQTWECANLTDRHFPSTTVDRCVKYFIIAFLRSKKSSKMSFESFSGKLPASRKGFRQTLLLYFNDDVISYYLVDDVIDRWRHNFKSRQVPAKLVQICRSRLGLTRWALSCLVTSDKMDFAQSLVLGNPAHSSPPN